MVKGGNSEDVFWHVLVLSRIADYLDLMKKTTAVQLLASVKAPDSRGVVGVGIAKGGLGLW